MNTPPPSRNGTVRHAARSFRRVLFFGKNMSRSRCTGGLVDALERHGLEVKWINMATRRRWLGRKRAITSARRSWERYAPDLVFVFCRDLPLPLLRELKGTCPVVLWVEEPLDDLDVSVAEYMAHGDLVCMSNPSHFDWLHRHGVRNTVFLMSGFSPRYHYPVGPLSPRRDVVFIGGPGKRGQRAAFLARISEHVHTEIFGVEAAWQHWTHQYPKLRVFKPVDNAGFRRICATSRIVLGLNQVNEDPCYFSNRTFLTLACRAFHLTHYVPGLEDVFRDGEHLAWYHDLDECVAKIEHYLAADEERERIAAAGHDLVLARHQYYHRVERILEILRRGGAPSEPMLPAVADLDASPPESVPRTPTASR